jgi:hypothetical protein
LDRKRYVSFREEIFGMFREWRSEPMRLLQAREGVVIVLLPGHGIGSSSGAPVELDLAEIWELRDGVPLGAGVGMDPSDAGELRNP